MFVYLAANKKLSMGSGMIIAVPIPEEHSIPFIDDIISQSLLEAK